MNRRTRVVTFGDDTRTNYAKHERGSTRHHPTLFGVVRNLPAGAAPAELDPVVALAQAGLDPSARRATPMPSADAKLGLARVPPGLRIERIGEFCSYPEGRTTFAEC
jgi:hypothetical protein